MYVQPVPPGSLTLTVNPDGCSSVLYMDCFAWAMIRLSAKRRRKQTSPIVAVFISSYVIQLTFFVSNCGFTAENKQSSLRHNVNALLN